MEFPSDIASNAFRIDDIEEVQWAFYAREHIDETRPPEDQLNDGGADLESLLHFAEGTLRDRGKHVLVDEDDPGIWVFSLSPDGKEGIAQVLNSVGLVCLKTGTVQALDITGTSAGKGLVQRQYNIPKVAPPLSQGPGPPNAQSFSANPKIMSQILSQDLPHTAHVRQVFSITELYSRIVEAISRSLTHSLANYKDFLQIGPNSCIEARTLGDRYIEELGLHWSSAKTAILSLVVKWLPSGTLVVLCTKSYLPRLSQLSCILSQGEYGRVPLGTPLLLSPSGVVARYGGPGDIAEKHSSYRSSSDIKSSVSVRLAQSGTPVPQDSKWLRVLVEYGSNDNYCQHLDSQIRKTFMTLWPAQLCYYNDVVSSGHDHEAHSIESYKGIGPSDVLTKAEFWYQGKANRKEELQSPRRKAEAEAWRAKEFQDIDDEDDLSDVGPPLSQYTAPEDVSGIYPTPPDGVPSNALDLSPNSNLHPGGIEHGEHAELTPDTINRPYGEHGNGDLFGEMDIDMFASNGLTEADFSFFDQPSMDDREMEEVTDAILVESDLDEKDTSNLVLSALPSYDRSELRPAAGGGHMFGGQAPLYEAQEAGFMENTSLKALHFQETDEGFNIEEDPLDPLDVDPEALDNESDSRQRSSFDAVRFRGISGGFDRKYALQGRYGFDVVEVPTTSKPGEHFHGQQQFPKLGLNRANGSPSEDSMDTDQTDRESSSWSSGTWNDCNRSHKDVSRKRKRKSHEPEEPDDMTTPLSFASVLENSAKEPDSTLGHPTQEMFSPRATAQARDCSTIGPPSISFNMPAFIGKDARFIQIAQIVADQAKNRCDSSSGFAGSGHAMEPSLAATTGRNQDFEGVMAKLSNSCGKISKRCTVREYASLGDKGLGDEHWEHTALQNSQKMSKPSYLSRPFSSAPENVYKLELPYTCVRRIGTSIDIGASALRFWEELSLAPAHDSKNVTAFCIYPGNDYVRAGVLTFLNMIKGAYQSCNMGLHNLGAGLPEYIDGLVPVRMGNDVSDNSLPDMGAACKILGARLGQLRLQGGNTVIYVFDSPNHDRALPTICACFLNLFEIYKKALSEQQVDEPNDLVLQVLPFHLTFSTKLIPMPSPMYYRRIAFEVYDRCSPKDLKTRSHYLSAPAIRLAKTVPKTIDLKLTPENIAPRLQLDNCIHIAYSWSPGDHWLTASWSDNLGMLSWNACYCFGDEVEMPWLSFGEIAKDIWGITCEMMQPRSSTWHIFICKDTPTHKAELDGKHLSTPCMGPRLIKSSAWQDLLLENEPHISIAFLTIDPNPLLDFILPDSVNRLPQPASGLIATPGNTPQSTAASPDISGLSTTPSGAAQVSTPPSSNAFVEHDLEARLIDITNETWGVIMNNALEDSSLSNHKHLYICPILACAYLVRRAGPRDEDGLVRCCINIIQGQTKHKVALKEVLDMYAGLALLSRVRAMENGESIERGKSILPIHVIAARRAHAAVNATMRYGDG